jgi:hypothetical protein
VYGITDYVPPFQDDGIGYWRKAEDFVDLHSVSGRGAFDFAYAANDQGTTRQFPTAVLFADSFTDVWLSTDCTRISGSIYWTRVRRRACSRRLPPCRRQHVT